MKREPLLRAVAFLAAFSVGLLSGQIITASVEGIVLDPAGAAVPNAMLRALDTSRGLEVRTTAVADGHYSFPSLPPHAAFRRGS